MTDFNINVEPTNNENIVKFVAKSFFTQAKSFEFKNIDDAQNSPIAQQLFHLPFVKTVYISQNFIALEKYSIIDWSEVQDEVATSISEYLQSGKPVVIVADSTAKTPVTVYAESTPNPTVMKFVANKPLATGTFEFKDIDAAQHSPLAQALFNFPFVKEVFISANYVSVMKYNMAEWQEISLELREFIRTYIEDGKTILSDEILNAQESKSATDASGTTPTATPKREYTDIEAEIISILDEYVKPAVAGDGGNIAFDSFVEETKTVRVILQGACSGCPSSTMTLKNGIQTMLNDMLDGRVETVEAVNG